jgi:hypothetical protein
VIILPELLRLISVYGLHHKGIQVLGQQIADSAIRHIEVSQAVLATVHKRTGIGYLLMLPKTVGQKCSVDLAS